MIPQDTIERIRDSVDIADVIGEYVRLKKRGKNFLGLCPFHTEKTPSFTVSPDKQMYYCFGCGKGGNAITFLMEHEKMTFVEAVRLLAQRANIVIKETGSDYRREQLERLNYAHVVALEYFRKLLFDRRFAKVLDGYLRGRRQISDESIEMFQLGLAGEDWDGLIRFASSKDLSPADLEQAGLAVHSDKKDSYFDRFRARLMIPIFNLSQKPIAFGGRTLKKGETAKYVNSPETPLYSKSFVLYGLNFAKDAIRSSAEVFIVEGYFDLISLWQAGIHNVVASSGTAFTAQQARLLARFAEKVYLFFDADSAGQQAALRSVDALYDAGLEVKVMVGPEGEDPDTLARAGGYARVYELHDAALDYIAYRLRNVDVASAGLIAKEKLIKELAAVGAQIGDSTRRALFYDEAATALRVDKTLLAAGVSSPMPSAQRVAEKRRKLNKIELDFLSLLFNNPGSIDYVFERVSPDDFDSKQLSRLYTAMITQYQSSGELDAARLLETFQDDEMKSLVGEISFIEWPPESVSEQTRAHTSRIIEERRKKIRLRLQRELAEAEATGDTDRANQLLEELKGYGL
ncbi:MAG: DNA primase [candidate division Zixibacteria bacterium]|jgi:DNA primase|nr:DNA primase [candidate division Zixibacteria bacterium]